MNNISNIQFTYIRNSIIIVYKEFVKQQFNIWEENMGIIFESIMLACLCAAMVVMICRFTKERSVHVKLDRSIVITMGGGFVIGAVSKAISAPIVWTFVLYVVGAYLAYTAVLFSFPNIGREVSENE